jgi:hypothetical protein
LSTACEPDAVPDGAPSRPALRSRPRPRASSRARTASARCAPTQHASEVQERLPPTGPGAPLLACARSLAAGPPLEPRLCHRDPASDTCSRPATRARALDPRAPGYSPEPACRVPPVDFCNRVNPRAHLRAVQSPALDATASRRAPSRRASFEAPSAGLPLARDRRDRSRGPPLRRPLAAVDLPRPARPGHPMSQARAQHGPETGAAERPCG